MKKALSLTMTIILLVCFMAGCSQRNTEFSSYNEGGRSLVSLSRELASNEEYIKSYNITEEQRELLDKLTSSDDHEPVRVFSLEFSENTLELLSIDTDNCFENVKAYLSNNVMTSIPSMINAVSGESSAVVASSIAAASMTFDLGDAEAPFIYFYIFENEISYAVNFKSGYDDSVFAVATPIFDEELSSCRNVDDIVNFLKKYSFKIDPDDISLIATTD